jgi:prepilin-type N-terminal cleavage/methylation domain-containing protein
VRGAPRRCGGAPPRVSRTRGDDSPGYTLSEMLFVLALIAVVGGMAVPQVLAGLDRSRGLIAARYLASRMAIARLQATARATTIAIRFAEGPDGIDFQTFEDGNRNGVLTADIQQQIDVSIEPAVRLWELFPGAEIGLTPDSPAARPVDLAGGSSLLSFTPLGTATSGSVYVRGPDGTQWAVRVLGATARARLLRFDARARQWRTQF